MIAVIIKKKTIVYIIFYNSGLTPDWLNDDFELPKKAPCIISVLCEIKEGLAVEAATMKEYSWRPVIKSFFDKGVSRKIILIIQINVLKSTTLKEKKNFSAICT